MRFAFCLLLALFNSMAFSLPLWERPGSFPEYEKQKNRFESLQKTLLKERLEELKRIRHQKSPLKDNKALLEHKERQKQFDKKRKQAFADYKKRYRAYQAQQKQIHLVRLKTLKDIRRKMKSMEDKESLFDF